MKTTLRYNTIETLQRQAAWKKLVDALVDECNPLFEDNLIADVAEERLKNNGVGVEVLRLFDKRVAAEYASYDPVADYDLVQKYASTYAKYGGLSVLDKDLQARYAVTDYLSEVMHMNLRENVSLRGLLRTLSLYGCKIKSVEQDESGLPHTFKVESTQKDTAIYGYNTSNLTYDHETRGKTPAGTTYGNDYDGGDIEADCYDVIIDKNYEEENTNFKYIYNIYGYNQKNPVISTSPIHEVLRFFKLKKKNDAPSSLPAYVYLDESNVIDIASLKMSSEFYYKSADDKCTGIFPCEIEDLIVELEDGVLRGTETLVQYYTVTADIESKWVSGSETSYLFNENERIDLVKDGRIKYNSTEHALLEYKGVRFALTEDASIERAKKFTRDETEGQLVGKTSPTTAVEMTYYVYIDSVYSKRWIVLDDINDYFKVTPSFLKSQLYANECTLKAQPLFLYDVREADPDHSGETKLVRYVSMCPNFINTGTPGGVGKLTYEIEMYNANNIVPKEVVRKNNADNGALIAVDKFYGSDYYFWEQFKNDMSLFYIRDVFAALKFDSVERTGNFYSLEHLFDGGKKTFFVGEEDFSDNKQKIIGDSIFENTYRQETFETMYFNHFVKVYPIVDGESSGVVSTMKLYCENLELVLFGDIVPYIVSYDRLGADDNEDGLVDDIDCSIFSKIVAYNKRTHLITVNNPVYFKDAHSYKYVVVAYQNASPFNKIKSLDITTPNIYDYKHKDTLDGGDYGDYKDVDETLTFNLKRVVGDILADYENESCKLNLYAECEYGGDRMI